MNDLTDSYIQSLGAARRAQENLQGTPEDAVRAFQLAQASGVPAERIGSDPSDFDQQFKSRLGGQIVGQNPYLSDFVNAHPLHAQLVSDELPQLDRFTRAASRLHEADLGWSDVGPAFISGFSNAMRSMSQIGSAVTRNRPTGLPESAAAAPYVWSDVIHPASLASKTAYGLAESAPTIAGSFAGSLIGAGYGGEAGGAPGAIVGGIGGAGLGAAGVELIKSFGPNFTRNLQETPDDPDGAYRRAWRDTGIQAGFSGLAFASFMSKFGIEGPMKRAAFQIFGVQPGLAVTQKAVENKLHDRPFDEDLAQTYAQSVIGTLLPVAGFEALRAGGRAGMGPFRPGGRFNPLEGEVLPPEGEPPSPGGIGEAPTIDLEAEPGPTDMSRRSFLKGTAAVAAKMAMSEAELPGMDFGEFVPEVPMMSPAVKNLVEDTWFRYATYPYSEHGRSDPEYVEDVLRNLTDRGDTWKKWLADVKADAPPRYKVSWNYGLTKEQAIQEATSRINDVQDAINAINHGFKPDRAEYLARNNAEFWEAYNEAKEQFPDGVDEVQDELSSQRADQNRDLLDKAVDESETDLKQNLPDKLHELARQIPDVPVRIPLDVAMKLYGGTEPRPGDNILGWIPGLKDRLKTPVGNIQVSSNEYLARTPKEIHKALAEFIGLGSSPSQAEVKSIKEQQAARKEAEANAYDHEAAVKESGEIGEQLANEAFAAGVPLEEAEAHGQLTSFVYRARAARLRISPKQLWGEDNLRIQREGEVEGKALEQPSDPFAEGKKAITEALNKLFARGRGNTYIQVPEGGRGIYARWNSHSRQLDVANVDFDNRGTGAFTAYLDHMEQWAADNGARRVVIENIVNDRLKPFAEKRGYRIEPLNIGDIDSAIKDLPESFDQPSQTYFSLPIRAIEAAKIDSAPAATWIRALNKIQGVKQEQLDWMEVKPWLLSRKGEVSKADLLEFMNANDLKVHEVIHGKRPQEIEDQIQGMARQLENFQDDPELSEKENNAAYNEIHDQRAELQAAFPRNVVMGHSSQYNFQGGTNRRQIVLTLPQQIDPYNTEDQIHFGSAGGGTNIGWGRVFDITIDGKKYLGVDEIQSKRHQEAMKHGYQIEGVKNPEAIPDAPYKTSWVEFIAKRLMRLAAEEGYAGIYMPGAEFQAERNERKIERITGFKTKSYGELGTPNHNIYFNDVEGTKNYIPVIHAGDTTETAKVIGPELAKKVLEYHNEADKEQRYYRPEKEWTGLNVRTGGALYRRIYGMVSENKPGEAALAFNSLAKKFGQKMYPSSAQGFEKGLVFKGPTWTGEGILARAIETIRRGGAVNNMIAEALHRLGNRVQAGADFNEIINSEFQGSGIAAALGGEFSQPERTVPGWRMDFTPELVQHVVSQGFPLMQESAGRITLNNAGAIIQLFKDANKSTLTEELLHHWGTRIFEDAKRAEATPEAIALRDFLLKGLGREPESITDWRDLPVEDHERLATAGLQYLEEGNAPREELKTVFQKFKEWFKALFQTIFRMGITINDDLREFYAKMFGKDLAVEEVTRGDQSTLDAMRKGAGLDVNFADQAHSFDQPGEDEYLNHIAEEKDNKEKILRDILAENLPSHGKIALDYYMRRILRGDKEDTPQHIWDFIRLGVSPTVRESIPKEVPGVVKRVMEQLNFLREEGKRIQGDTNPRSFNQPGPQDIFKSASAIGRTKRMIQKYQELWLERVRKDMEWRQKNAEKLADKLEAADMKREASRVRPEIEKEVKSRPEVAMYTKFEEGRVKIDKASLTPEQLAKIPSSFVSDTGLPADAVARTFGYDSGEEVADTLSAMEKAAEGFTGSIVDRLTAAEVRDHLLEKIQGTPEERLDDILHHALDETQMELLHQKTLILGWAMGVELPLTKEQMAWGARELMHRDSFDKFKAARYLKEAGKAGRELEKALLEKNTSEAFKQAQAQFIALAQAKEAGAVEREMRQFKKLVRTFSKREVKGVPADYTNWIHDILLRTYNIDNRVRGIADLQKEISADAAGTGKTLQQFALNKQAAGIDFFVPDFLLAPTWNSEMADLNVLQARQVMRAVKTLATAGRNEQRIITQGNKKDLIDAITTMINQLETIPPAVNARPMTLRKLNRWVNVQLLQVETLLGRWDYGNIFGVFNQHIGRPLFEAANYEARLDREVAAEYKKLEGQADKDYLRQTVPNKLFKDPMQAWVRDPTTAQLKFDWDKADYIQIDRRRLRAILLNAGNLDNLERMATGHGLDSQTVFQWLVDNATEEDWKWAQAHGDLFQRLKDLSDKMYRNLTGVAPEAIPIFPIKFSKNGKDFTFRGWYHPIIHDPLISQPWRKHNIEEGLLGANYVRAGTADGYTKSRTGYRGPLDLELDSVPTRFAQEIHDIAFREAVLNAAKVFSDPDFQMAVTKHYGKEYSDLLMRWLKDVANGAAVNSETHGAGVMFLDYLRQNTAAVLIGLNPRTIEKHTITAAIQSLNQVGAGAWAEKFFQMWGADPAKGMSDWNWAVGKSEELQRRHQNYFDTLAGAQTSQLGRADRIKGIPDWAYTFRNTMQYIGTYPVGFMDLASAVPTWLAAYEQAFSGKVPKGYGGTGPRPGVDGDAVYYADNAVRRAHGSTVITNRPQAMRGGVLARMMTTFYTFFNHMWNKQYEMLWKARVAAGYTTDAAAQQAIKDMGPLGGLPGGLWAYVIAVAIVEELVTPYTNEDRDSWGSWAGKSLALALSGSVPGLRDLVRGLMDNKDPQAGLVAAPSQVVLQMYRDLSHGFKWDKEHAGKVIKHANSLIGIGTGLTNNEIGNLAEFSADLITGKARPKNAGDWYRGLTKGETRPREDRPDIIERSLRGLKYDKAYRR